MEGDPLIQSETLARNLQAGVDAGIPGLAAALATRDEIVWSGAAGVADMRTGTPIQAADMFGIGSITKVFVAVIVLQLVEEGRLRLDATFGSIIEMTTIRSIANRDTATVVHLLEHMSGVPSWEDELTWIKAARGESLDPTRIWRKSETLDHVRRREATSPAGSCYHYSNSNYTILGLIVEKITGITLETEVRDRILRPLGLTQTYFEGYEEPPGGRSPRRYHYATPEFVATAGIAPTSTFVGKLLAVGETNLSVEWAAGGLMSSVRDLVRFGSALRDGRLLSRQSLAIMKQWHTVSETTQAGRGLFRTLAKTGGVVGHNGGVLGFTASLWWSETSDVVVAVASNLGTMHAGAGLPSAVTVALSADFVCQAHDFAEA